MRELFDCDPRRGTELCAEHDGVVLDYSKNLVTDRTVSLLMRLARDRGLGAGIEAMFRGKRINTTEGRAVLHTVLRTPAAESVLLDGVDVVRSVHEVLDRMSDLADAIRSGRWRGATGRPVRTVVNIGIGGSDLGARDGLPGFARIRAGRDRGAVRVERRRSRYRPGPG